MRILFLNPVGAIGGAERVLLASIRGVSDHLPEARSTLLLFAEGQLEDEARRLGAQVRVVSLPPELANLGDTKLRSEAANGAKVHREFWWKSVKHVPAAAGFLRRLHAEVRSCAPDLIHSNGFKAHTVAALVRPRSVPVIWHMHDMLSQRPLMARLLRKLSSRAAGAIAVSETVHRDLDDAIPGLKVSLVRNSVDTEHFSPAYRDGAELDRLAGMRPADQNVIRVGLVATYANWKGQDIFLDAMARLVETHPQLRGYVVGGPIYATSGSQFSLDELKQRSAAHGLLDRVGFIPFQSDPVDIYRMLDVVVHASIRPEPFGLTIVEAMACGRPVVVSAAGGAAELLSPECDGLGYSPGDVEGLFNAVARLVATPALRDRLASNARLTAVTRYSQERFGREIAAVYSEFQARSQKHRSNSN